MLYLRQLASQYNKNKLDALRDIIEPTADRLIIFYNFNEEKKQISGTINNRPLSVLSGEMKELRNYENKENTITLVQYQAGATGVNLQKANKIIYYSLPLTSELFEQSKKRIHRIRTKKYMFLLLLNNRKTNRRKHIKNIKRKKRLYRKIIWRRYFNAGKLNVKFRKIRF